MDATGVWCDRYPWETPALAAEVRDTLEAIEAPPVDADVMFQFQKTLYRGRMFNVDGRGRIVLACRCILESEGNAGAFAEPFVSAVLSAACTEEFAGCGLELIEAFDKIRLTEIIETMKSLEFFLQKDVVSDLGTIVRNKLQRILFPQQPEPVKASKRESDKQAARARIIEQKIELGRKLAALRDTMPNNKIFGRTVRKQFGLDDPTEVAKMMLVARLYAGRPEIYRNVGWRALLQLASTLTSEAYRERIEARILAGERVNGADIIRGRGARTRCDTQAPSSAMV